MSLKNLNYDQNVLPGHLLRPGHLIPAAPSMMLLWYRIHFQVCPLRWSLPHRRSGCFAIVISGTVLTSLDLLLILDISRGATPIVVLCGNLSIDQLKFCVSCLRCYWYEPTLVCDSSQSIQRNCGTSSPAP